MQDVEAGGIWEGAEEGRRSTSVLAEMLLQVVAV
jgi:hypothetical protein